MNIEQIQAFAQNKYVIPGQSIAGNYLKVCVPVDREHLEQNIDGVAGEAAVGQVQHSHSLASEQREAYWCPCLSSGHLARSLERPWYTGRGWLSLWSRSRPPPGSLLSGLM